MTSLTNALIVIFAAGIIIFIERAFPFILFSKRNPPKIIAFIEQYIPPMVMAALLFYCLKDINFVTKIDQVAKIDWHNSLPYIIGVASTIGLHLWKRNSLISIFGGTAIYMLCIHIF